MVYQLDMGADAQDRRFTYVSAGVERLHGIDLATALADPRVLYDQVVPEDAAALGAAEAAAIAHMRPFRVETRFRLPDGRTRWSILSSAPRRLPNGHLIWDGIELDITERKRAEEAESRLEEQLARARRMEAVGTLAAGVAHDFNNILAGVLAGLSGLELSLTDEALRDEERSLEDLVVRGGEVVKRLLGFGRKGKLNPRPVALERCARATVDLFKRTRPDVVVAVELAPDLPPLHADETQLEQVLLNLLVNAGQAMPDGGRVTVTGSYAALDADDARAREVSPGEYVEVVVTDTGIGMDAATRERLFEPFFTTKAPGTGSGMGLASAYGIVKNHGGAIGVESEPGRGARFTLLFPATDAPVSRRAASLVAPASRKGTILVVDDEEVLLRICARLLERMGYEVLTAPGGTAAIEAVRAHGKAISLVILDLTMPEMSGARTFEALRALEPDIKILLSSGFSVDGSARELLARGCSGFLAKPFTTSELDAKLSALM
jgi:PAS domain S-box-containing protein